MVILMSVVFWKKGLSNILHSFQKTFFLHSIKIFFFLIRNNFFQERIGITQFINLFERNLKLFMVFIYNNFSYTVVTRKH